ncbi:hypothetical protein X777_07117, partial [Ooceraea biroi]
RSSSADDTSTSAFSLQPASLPRRRSTRIGDRHLHNVPDALELTRQSRRRGSTSAEDATILLPMATTTWANRTRDSPGCVAHRDACTRNMIAVIAT